MQIYNDRPIPVRRRGKAAMYRNLIESLEPGQSFDAPYTDKDVIRSLGVSIITRRNDDVLMVWKKTE